MRNQKKRKTYLKRYYKKNKRRINARQKRWRKENPDKAIAIFRRYQKKHRKKINEVKRDWRKRNLKRERKREKDWRHRNRPHLRRKFGITLEQYTEMLSNQAGGCAICGTNKPGKAWGRANERVLFCVDHDHKTGEVRGLLCDGCNRTLGGFNDNIELLIAAVRYLRAAH